jgi:hypothetical protein
VGESRRARTIWLQAGSSAFLWRKYRQVFTLLDAQRLTDVARDFGPDFNPFDLHRRTVIALEILIEHPQLTGQAVKEGIDLLVVDEAQRLCRPKGHPVDPAPKGDLIVYAGTQVNAYAPILAVRPDGTSIDLREILVFRTGQRFRFLPDGEGLVYMQGELISAQGFWLLDLKSLSSRRLTELNSSATMNSFDITPDGATIVFDRLRQNSDIVLIDLAN